MTTLHEQNEQPDRFDIRLAAASIERRQHRRHDLEAWGIQIDRWDGQRHTGTALGHVLDLSAGGICIRTHRMDIRPEQQIRVRIELPAYAGVCPFVDTSGAALKPSRQWIGWMAVSRVRRLSPTQSEVAGELIDMDQIDRGMLKLYLSTQPLAA